MGFVESVKAPENRVKIGVACGLLAVAGVFAAYSSSSDKTGEPVVSRGKAFFSVDDGATVFTDSDELIPPFVHDGKTAVRAYVYSVDGGKSKAVGYLERFDSAAKKQADAKLKVVRSVTNTEVKKPLSVGSPWVSHNSTAGIEIVNAASKVGGKDAELLQP